MSLPLLCGSLQVRKADVGLATALIDTMEEGLEGGVTHGLEGEKGPTPALLMAWKKTRRDGKSGSWLLNDDNDDDNKHC